jgi:hypothetical protein
LKKVGALDRDILLVRHARQNSRWASIRNPAGSASMNNLSVGLVVNVSETAVCRKSWRVVEGYALNWIKFTARFLRHTLFHQLTNTPLA